MERRKNSISIKINGTEQKFKEEVSKESVSSKEKHTNNTKNESKPTKKKIANNYYNENKPLTETDKLAELILKGEQPEQHLKESETIELQNTNKGKNYEEPATMADNSYYDFSPSYRNKRGHLKQRWHSSLFAMFLAILVGTSFGYIIKKVITTDHLIETVANNEINNINQQSLVKTNEEENGEQTSTTITIDPQIFFVVQAGVFSSLESAEVFVDEIKSKNIATILDDSGEKLYVYIGIANSLDMAKQIGKHYENKDVDFYAKEIYIDGKQLTVVEENTEQFFERALPLYEQLVVSSSSLYLGNILPDGWDEQIKSSLKEIEQYNIYEDNIIMLKDSLVKASNLLLTNVESITNEQFLQVETELMSFLTSYKSL